jgi:hypothetical protein
VLVVGALVALVGGGAALAVTDANARLDAVYAEADRVAEEQGSSGEAVRNYFTQPDFVRQILADSMVDGVTPRLITEGEGATVNITYGAFGVAGYYPVPLRPWALQPVAAPLGAAVVLAITATLVAASRWTPRESGPAPARRVRRDAS